MSKSRNKKKPRPVIIHSHAYTLPHRDTFNEMAEDPVYLRIDTALVALLNMFEEGFRYKKVFYYYNPATDVNLMSPIIQAFEDIGRSAMESDNKYIVQQMHIMAHNILNLIKTVDDSSDVRQYLSGSGDLDTQRELVPYFDN